MKSLTENNFKKYSSIENSYRLKFVNQIREKYSQEKYIVQEKIHGANFSFCITHTGIKCAKRSTFLAEKENFYNSKKVLNKYKNQLEQLYVENFNENDEVVIYGEIYGGSYPHKDVLSTRDKKVQSGVFYAPDGDFIAFDMLVNGTFLSILEMNRLLDSVQIPRSEILFEGTFEECLEFPNKFLTTLPSKKGLPLIENNFCEGVVIKPNQPLFLENGYRVIVKNKHEAFREDNGSKVKPPTNISPISSELIEKAVPYINENRLRAVISKIGTLTKKDFGKLVGLLVKDVMEDLGKDFEIEEIEDKEVAKFLNKEVGNFIRPYFINIIDGNF